MRATVEVNVGAVFRLPVSILTITSLEDAMTFNLAFLNAHARDTTAHPEKLNLLVRPMVGVSPKAIF